jgi:hypothetical protein
MSIRTSSLIQVAGAVALLVSLVGCELTRMLPKGPVVDEKTRSAVWSDHQPSEVDYTDAPRVDHPVLPFMIFGLTYDLDVVLVSNHPDWEMHEYARLLTPNGPVWLAKDTRRSNGNQILVGDAEVLRDRLPEIPLRRHPSGLTVRDRSSDGELDLEFAYENVDGEQVRAEYRGPVPDRQLPRANGSTMGHSRHQVMAVLDLPRRNFGDSASISIGGRQRRITRMLGLQPMRLALTQTQGGIPEADVTFDSLEDVDDDMPVAGFRSQHRLPGDLEMTRRWASTTVRDSVVVYQRSAWRTLAYRFARRPDGALELTGARVVDHRDDHTTFRLEFSPALPDLRRPFDGSHESRVVMDVGEGRNHAVGTVEVRSDADRVEVRVRASRPWWVADRCVDSSIRRTPDAPATLSTEVRPCP